MIVITGRLRVEMEGGDERARTRARASTRRPNVPHRVTAVEDTVVISCKDVLDGVGHKVAPGERDQLDRLGKELAAPARAGDLAALGAAQRQQQVGAAEAAGVAGHHGLLRRRVVGQPVPLAAGSGGRGRRSCCGRRPSRW